MLTLAFAALLLTAQLCPCLCAQTPIPPVPEKDWRVQAVLCTGDQPETYAVRLEPYPDGAFTYVTNTAGIQATVTDAQGHRMPTAVALLPEPPAVPEYGPLQRKHDLPGLRWIGLRWKPRGLRTGLYTLTVSVPVISKNAMGRAIALPEASDTLRVYRAPTPDRLPAQTPGQRFLCLPDWMVGLPYLDAHGQTLRQARLASKLFTLTRIDRTGRWPMVYFRVEGVPGLVHIENGGPLSALPGLCLLVEDAELRRLRRKYAGRQVWGYGGIGGQCVQADSGESSAVGLDKARPCRLVHLVRIRQTATQLSIGTRPGVLGGVAQSAFTMDYPLVAILTPPAHTQVAGFSLARVHGRRHVRERPDGEPIFQMSQCHTLYNEFAGAWDFERTYSLISPRQAGRHWPRVLRKAVLSGEIRRGMTPEMVAWTMGYPSAYGTAAQIKVQSVWQYDTLPPFHYDVDFQNGKVSSFRPDGELP